MKNLHVCWSRQISTLLRQLESTESTVWPRGLKINADARARNFFSSEVHLHEHTHRQSLPYSYRHTETHKHADTQTHRHTLILHIFWRWDWIMVIFHLPNTVCNIYFSLCIVYFDFLLFWLGGGVGGGSRIIPICQTQFEIFRFFC